LLPDSIYLAYDSESIESRGLTSRKLLLVNFKKTPVGKLYENSCWKTLRKLLLVNFMKTPVGKLYENSCWKTLRKLLLENFTFFRR